MTESAATFSNGASKAPPLSRLVRAKDLALDHEYWANPRSDTDLDDKSIAELAADIRLRGVQIALVVVKVKSTSGGVTDLVIDGQRRTLAALEVDPTMLLPVIDKVAEPIDLTWEVSDRLLLDMLAVGTKRAGLSDYELSQVAERMKLRGKSLEDIGDAIGKSPSWCSRILTARANAQPKLMLQWRKGQVTTEIFKELAAVKDATKQEEKTAQVVEASKSGNKGEARALAKEAAITSKAEKPVPPKAAPQVAPVVKGPQVDMFGDGKKAVPAPKPRKPGPTRIQMEDVVAMAVKRPPTSEQVKGIILGIRYALGEVEPDAFGKGYDVWVRRVHGVITKKSAKPTKSAKVKKPAKARKVAKKPAKKSKR